MQRDFARRISDRLVHETPMREAWRASLPLAAVGILTQKNFALALVLSAGLCACAAHQPAAQSYGAESRAQGHAASAGMSAAKPDSKSANVIADSRESPEQYVHRLEALAESQRSRAAVASDAWTQLGSLVLDASRDTSPVTRAAWSTEKIVAQFKHADRHGMSLDAAIAAITNANGALNEAAAKSESDNPESVRAYASAKVRALAGDTKGAIEELQTALQNDPESLTLRSELGMLQLRAGRRTAGIAMLRQAVEAGLRDANVLRALAKEENRSGNIDQSLLLLVTAREQSAHAKDDLDSAMLRADLGERLADAEYFAASRDMLSGLAGINVEAFSASDLRSAEASEFLRKRPALLMLAGDLSVLDEKWDVATTCYDASMKVNPLLDAPARLRAAGVALRTGQTAQAALQVLRSLRDGGMPQPWHEEVAKTLRGERDTSENFRGALVSGAAKQRPTVCMGRIMLAAVCDDDAGGAKLLERAMVQFGASDKALDRLVDAMDRDKSKSMSVDAVCGSLERIVELHGDDSTICAAALVRHGRELHACRERLSRGAKAHVSAALLASSLDLYFSDADAAMGVLDGVPDASRSLADVQLMRILALKDLGRATEARDVALRVAADSAGTPASRARSLLAVGEATKALEVVASKIEKSESRDAIGNATDTAGEDDSRATIDALLVGADAAKASADVKRASEYLASAAALDPASDDIAAKRFAIATSESVADAQAAAVVIRELRDANPSSRWLSLLVAQDMSQRGLARPAQRELESIVDDRGEPAVALSMLVEMWSKDKAQLDGAVTRVTAQLRERPDSPSLTLGLAKLLSAVDKAQDANDLLAAQYAKFPLDDFARLREDLLRNKLGKPDEADRLLAERLQKRPMGFAAGIELTQSLLAGGSFERGLTSLRTLLASSQTLMPEQLKAVSVLHDLVAPAKVAKAAPAAQAAALEVSDLLHARGAILTAEQAGDRAELFSFVHPMESGGILDAIDEAAAKDAQVRAVLIDRVARRLFAMDDATPGLRLLEELNLRTDPPSALLGREWLAQTIRLGNIEDVSRMVKNWKDGEHLAQSLAMLQLSPDFVGETLDENRAEFAYFLGGVFTQIGRDELSARTYRLVFELEPKHTWASNNLGYMILERGGSIEEAATLIEQAHEAEPEEPSIIDSLGWLRYKQGMIEDSVDANGVKKEGAITLLERAADQPRGESNWEMQDHLADAYWRRNKGDDREKAKRAWRAASAILRDTLAFTQFGNRNQKDVPPLIVEFRERQKEIGEKLGAAIQGDEPAVSQTSIPPEFKPRPEPAKTRLQQQQFGPDVLVP